MAAAAATAAGAVNAPPANAPVIAPLVRLGASPSATTISRHAGALTALDPDEWTLPRDSPVVDAFPFLQWSIAPSGGPALVAMSELQGICITACSFDMDDHSLARALRGANLIESGLSAAACSAVLHELHDARLLDYTFKGEGDFLEALACSTLVQRSALTCQLGWLETYEPFDRPGAAAVPAVPAVAGRRGQPATPAVPAVPAAPPTPGPAALRFLRLTSWAAARTVTARRRLQRAGIAFAWLAA
ncbi:hypothetical protein AB1Y20_013671 [Prymnesium parvum]|uniref:Uncharacterized protein n=1 Tax=Prymnesium parvum TaxID=97485 RepID=A0AB34IIG8_PRYPA